MQSLSVWSPSVPVNASVSPLPSSQAPVLISGPLDLKTRGPHPILPPLKNTHPPPRQSTGPARSASLRRQLSQNSIRQQTSSPSPNQSYNNSNDPENNFNNINQHQQQQQYYPQQDSADSRPPFSSSSSTSSIQYSNYGRGPSSSPGSGSEGGNGSSRMLPMSQNDSHLSPSSSPGLSRSNSRINYSSPLLRSHSRSGSNSPSSPPSSSPSQSPLKRSTSILKNGPKDAPYLNNNNGTKSHLESLNQTWEPSGPSPALPTGSSQIPNHNGSQHALSQFGSASNLRAKAAAAAAAAAASTPNEVDSNTAGDQESKDNGGTAITAPTTAPGQGPSSTSAFDPATQPALMPHQEQKDKEFAHNPVRDSENYKVLVPPSPVASPHIGPSSGSAAHAQAQAGNNFNFLNSDPTLSRSSSRRRMAPPIQVPTTQQPSMPSGGPQSALSPQSQGITSPVSPGRRHPFHRWENMTPPQHQGGEANNNGYLGPGGPRGYTPNRGQGQGQDHHEDGDYEDEGLNDDTDGDALSGPEDQSRRHHRRQQSAGGDGPFTPTRSAPQPPSLNSGGGGGSGGNSGNGGVAPNSREAEMAHIMYIQQQQALFLQEKAMNPPLKNKSSNGNLSGGNSDGSKIRRKGSRHRKQISVISEPKLLSSTNQIKTVPIVRPADQSDNEDAENKSEYTSGGEGIKNKVRRMRRAVRHAANGVFNDDDSDREDGLGSKSDAEKKGGLKQLKALKSKLAKKLNRPSHGGTSSSRHDLHGGPGGEHGDEEGGRAPVQFFSEDNLRARFLEQQQAGGHSLAAAGASLRRSNTTRENTGAMFNRRDPYGTGDKEEYDSGDEGKNGAIAEEGPETELTPQEAEDAAAATKKAKMAKFGSRTFDKDEMMEVKDGTGESFFVPRWNLDPRADELGSSKSVISVTSSRKLERSASNATAISTTTIPVKPALSISERLQASMIAEQDGENVASDDKVTTESKDAESAAVVAEDAEGEVTPTGPKKLTWGESNEEALTVDAQADKEADKEAAAAVSAESADQVDPNVSASSSSGLTSRASVMSEASSNASSVAGIVVAQVLTRQNSMRKNFSRPAVGEAKKQQQQEEAQEKSVEQQQEVPQQLEDGAASTQTDSPRLGLGISLPSSAAAEKPRESLEEVMADMSQYQGYQGGAPEKQLPPIPQDESPHMKPVAPMTIRPLSPIRRTTANSTASMTSVLSTPSSPPANHRTISPLDTAAVQQDAEAVQAGLGNNYNYSATVTAASPTSPTKAGSLRSNMSFNAFALSQGPTSPLPSPSIPNAATGGESPAPPASPFPLPAVLARQGSHLTERASVRSMYADSIYDCYDYDSGSEYDAQDPSMISRQESFRSQFAEQQENATVAESSLVASIARVSEVVSRRVVEESPVLSPTATTTKTATAMAPSKAEAESVATVVVSLNKEDEQTQTQVPESVETGPTTSSATSGISGSEELPVIRLRGAAAAAAAAAAGASGVNGQNRDSQTLKEEHHILFEDIPKAVPYRMSMMTTVPVDPVGVAASLSVPLLAAGGIAGVSVAGAGPSRPTRNPMRQSRHGSMLSIGGSSDLTTTDSWMSSSVRDTRDDMSGWDIRGEHHRPDTVDENESVRRISLSVSSRTGDYDDQDGERARRPSVESFMTSSSLASSAFQARRRSSVRSERTMSIMTDKSSLIIEEEGSASSDESDGENSTARRDLKIRIKGLESSGGSDSENEHVTGLKEGESPEGSVIRHKKQWYKERRTSASKRETWGSIQSSSSSDSNTTSSSSSGSSHSNFYFNGRSPSPSPTEETAAVSTSAMPF
ncbi:hypothetical protein EC957_000806 [Mortierella hygrophila]|uniref:Uncharacterized protein n=1 Tax=Mortierella hygrophila TaxID=979708 RepID=A0A9P6F6K8_9FUNG|nr:hypothetical protein EC957_000806 [Mortierella hygrophila]